MRETSPNFNLFLASYFSITFDLTTEEILKGDAFPKIGIS